MHSNSKKADIYLVDGKALAPSDFGTLDDDGIFKPFSKPNVDLSGSGSFHLEFASSDLGEDTSGNGNHFTNYGVEQDDEVALVSDLE